jgi:molecular chaperone DnaJ
VTAVLGQLISNMATALIVIPIALSAAAETGVSGRPLLMTVNVAVHEAALGARVEIGTLEGAARLRIPPGTQTGQRFRLRGQGAPSTRNGMRGDLIVEVRIMLPRLLDERSKELLREFGKINAAPVRE